MRIIAILTAWAILAAAIPVFADDATDQATLDQELLEGLGDDLFDGIEMPELAPSKSAGASPDEKPNRGESPKSDAEDTTNRPDGEDIGAEPENPLVNIGRQMQTVQDRIGQGQAENDTLALQNTIIKQLDDLIEQAKQHQQHQQQQQQNQNQQQKKEQQQQQQQQQNQQNQQQQKQQQQSQSEQQPKNGGSQTQPQEGEGEQEMSQQQQSDKANDSSDQVQDREYQLLPLEARGALIKEVWGQLPERVRQQLQNASVEKFLPKYERLTEEYFRRLAEQEQADR